MKQALELKVTDNTSGLGILHMGAEKPTTGDN
jgi:hypothetical protein